MENGIHLKRIWYKVYFFLWQLLQISFRRSKNLRQEGRYAQVTVILTARSPTCLLRNRNPGTLYIARASKQETWTKHKLLR